MILDPKWIEALKRPPKATLGALLVASVLWVLEENGVLDLGPLGPIASIVPLIIAVAGGMMTFVGFSDYLLKPFNAKQRQSVLAARRKLRKEERETEEATRRQTILAHLDNLSAYEIRVVAGALNAQPPSPTFYTYVNSPPATMLGGKGLVWTPGGAHNMDHYPFSFYTLVWEVLQQRRAEFLTKHTESERAEEARKQAERSRR